MHFDANGLRFSPTDLTVFLDGDFATWMDRWNYERKRAQAGTSSFSAVFLPAGLDPDCAPDPDDETLKIVKQKGLDHEREFLNSLKDQGIDVVEIPQSDQAQIKTLDAMREGVQTIYQAHLVAGGFGGYADFLFKVDGQSKLGGHHYEAWDTKLARSAKPYFILQLCAYADLLEQLQGRRPDEVAVVLGTKQSVRFATCNYFFYYRRLKRAFINFHNNFDPGQMPHPGLSRGFGRWSGVANKILAESDHLCGVARCTRRQIALLEKAGIATMKALATTNIAAVPSFDAAIFARLKVQARLQVESRGKAVPRFEVVRPTADDPRRGLALLPPLSAGDVYFDMEGHPLIDGGLEYLFGASYEEEGKLQFRDGWAHNLVQEKAAFEGFIDWVYARWQADPAMHIFHYAAYETTALRRLMGKYATREREMDNLLRHQVFVDLYAVVRQGLIVGTPSYSLKQVERLYLPPREGAVTDAGESIVFYQNWMDSGESHDWKQSKILGDIRDYNRVDCESTCQLAHWLREQQKIHKVSYLPESEEPPGEEEDDASGHTVNPATELANKLLGGIEVVADRERRRVQELLAWLLEFHWREAKPVFWRKFDRQSMTEQELVDDLDCLGGLQRTKKPPVLVRRSAVYEYRFDPDQDTKLTAGSKCFIAQDLSGATIETLDLEAGRVGVCISLGKPAPPARLSLIPNEYVSAKVITDAVYGYVNAWAGGTIICSAVDDLLHRRPPRIKGRSIGPLIDDGADLLPALVDLVRRMEGTTLCIQGPPGAGKSYTAAHVITELLKAGKRIGVMANSHKAILNLMEAVAEATGKAKVSASLVKIGGDDDDPLIRSGDVDFEPNSAAAIDHLSKGRVVIGGSAWVFSRPELLGRLDYLFVDEAGQVSLANIVGTAPSAKNLVLIGDQMQLAQPIQGSHPGESGQSALSYLLQSHATIPRELGIFLGTTWRMHPDVCRFISGAVYDGQLRSHESTIKQAVLCRSRDGDVIRRATGVVYVPVEHDGNAQSSAEEVDAIAGLVEELIGRCVVDREGQKRDLTLADILIVAPYNMQVRKLQAKLAAGARIGSVDKFQGQEAPVVIVSMCASSIEDCPRGIDFLLNKNRINVAVSRAMCLAIVVGCPELMAARCQSIAHMELVNLYCWLADYAESLPV